MAYTKNLPKAEDFFRLSAAPPRVALYIRVSTEEQSRHGLSLEDQRNALIEYAKSHGMQIVEIYEDAGISARKPYKSRPALLRLLDDVKSKKIDLILFTKLDRWFRNVGNYYAVQEVLDANNVSWQAILEDYETVTSSGRLKVNIMLSVAQDEADRTSERLKFTFEQKRARGEPTNGRCPLGYKIVNGHLQIDEDTAEAARDMFNYFIRTRSVVAVTKYMRENWGIRRAYKNFRLFLRNPIYIGKFYNSDCPALISQETWDRTREILSTRAQRIVTRENIYLFTGILCCAECGNNMSGEKLTKGGRDYIYYRCPGHSRGAGCEHTKRVREDKLEEWLVSNLIGLIEIHNLSVRRKNTEKPQKNISKIRSKMEKLKDLYLSDLIEKDMYIEEYTTLKKELDSAQVPEPPEKLIDPERLKDTLSIYSDLEKGGKKEFWSRTIRKIRATNEGDFFVELI